MSHTDRQAMAALLARAPLSARDLAYELQLTPAEVEAHLEHLRRSHKKNLRMTPAECQACGFVFKKRDRLDAPGRCPVCRAQRVAGPWFRIIP
jgi:predicted Zn-ribbon and HTH transcriptional regulator